MKGSEVRDLSPEQMEARLAELQEEMFNLRFQFATRQLTNTARIKQVRRDIARLQGRRSELALAGR